MNRLELHALDEAARILHRHRYPATAATVRAVFDEERDEAGALACASLGSHVEQACPEGGGTVCERCGATIPTTESRTR